MVIVHAEKRASARAAGAGAKTHNINAFVHPGGWVGRQPRLMSQSQEGGEIKRAERERLRNEGREEFTSS